MIITLTRDAAQSVGCSLGVLDVDGHHFQTIERPWVASQSCRAGTPHVSCVPEGTYKLVPHDSPKHPQTWALVNLDLGVCHDPSVGLRSDVLIHPANYASELEGCIAPGERRFLHGGEWAVVDSRRAFNMIKLLMQYPGDHSIVISKAVAA